MIGAAERYDMSRPLRTYLETANMTLYSHGPDGVEPFESFFEQNGTTCTLALMKPSHWRYYTQELVHKTHILVIREPLEQHLTASNIHIKSMKKLQQKRDNLFYHTHLHPYLSVVEDAEFDFYIDHANLKAYLYSDYKPRVVNEGPILFPIDNEMRAYNRIVRDKMALTIQNWKDLLLYGQVGSP